MNLFDGISYNLRGLYLGIKTPKLLFLGLIRFAAVILITLVSSAIILIYHQEIMDVVWSKPASHWIVWLWYLLSWVLSLFLVGVATVLSYLISQILFSVVIMDNMSRLTELRIRGRIKEPETIPLLTRFSYLLRQEIPRAILPVLLSLFLMILGWVIPLGSILVFLSSVVAIIFLAWDNTDLLPARRLSSFKKRFRLLLKALPFHLGFGLFFLIPVLNILFLSFAPVGATLYYLDKHDTGDDKTPHGSNSSMLNPIPFLT